LERALGWGFLTFMIKVESDEISILLFTAIR
jgi:hypothetical protein